MANSRTRLGVSARAFLVGVAACLVILQSLSAALAPHGRHVAHPGDETGVVASGGYEICRIDAQRAGENRPAQEHRHADQCCLICAAGGRDGAAFGAVFFAVVTNLLAPPIARIVDRPIVVDADGRPKGWASSWSSRAPPFLS